MQQRCCLRRNLQPLNAWRVVSITGNSRFIGRQSLQSKGCMKCRVLVGQNHIYTVNVWYVWQENNQIYGHIRCIYTVLASPNGVLCQSPATAGYWPSQSVQSKGYMACSVIHRKQQGYWPSQSVQSKEYMACSVIHRKQQGYWPSKTTIQRVHAV